MRPISDSPILRKIASMPLTRRITVGGGLLVVVILGGISYSAFSFDRRSNEVVSHSYRVLAGLERVLTGLSDIEAAQRGYALTGSPASYGEFQKAVNDVRAAEKDTRALVSDDEEQAGRIGRVISITELLLDQRARPSLSTMVDLAPARRETGRMISSARGMLHDRLVGKEENNRVSMIIVVGTSILAGLVSVLTALIFGRAQEEERCAAVAAAEQSKSLEKSNEELAERTRQLGLANDILQETAKELEARTLEAEGANASKADFLAAMSHELRTPLNGIMGYVDILEVGIHGQLSEAQLSDCQRIRHNSQHLLGLINNVLNFAKLERGTVEYDRVPVGLDDLMADVEPLVETQFLHKKITFVHDAREEECTICTDHDKAVQILINLLTNACKFTAAGGEVRVKTSIKGEHVRVAISDTGRGIPEDRLESIFEPFVQVDRHLHITSNQGVGLGLAISRDLARNMGGELWVESKVGQGSTFYVTFPCA